MKLDIQTKLNQKGMSRYELAKRIGVTYPTIDSIYKGKSTSIKLEILDALCNELDCTPNDILVSAKPQTAAKLKAYEKSLRKYGITTVKPITGDIIVETTLSKTKPHGISRSTINKIKNGDTV